MKNQLLKTDNFKVILFLLLFQFSNILFSQTEIYVDASISISSVNQNGNSWATAFKNLEQALSVSNNLTSGDCIIHLAEGTYKTPSQTFNSQSYYYFQILRGGVSLLGGYPSGGGEREAENHETILQGINEAEHVLIIVGTGSKNPNQVILSGLTIKGGRGNNWKPEIEVNGVSFSQKAGVGVYIKDLPNSINTKGVKFENVVFKDNITPTGQASDGFYGGGAVYAENCPIEIDDCEFYENGSGIGGAISMLNNSPIKLALNITKSLFQGNKILGSYAGFGGSAFYANNVDVSLSESLLKSNVSVNTSSMAGTIMQYGGSLNITNSTFSSNSSTDTNGSSGSVGGGGGALYFSSNNDINSSLYIDNCVFQENASRIGGAILLSGSSVADYGTYAIKNSKFIENRSYVEAGAIRNNFWGGSIYNTEFRGNISGGAAGAVCLNSPRDNYLVNTLFTGNYLQYEYYSGGTAYASVPSGFAIHKHQNGGMWIINSTFSGNSGTIPNWYYRPKGTIAISGTANNYIYNSIVYGNMDMNGTTYSIHNMDITGDYSDVDDPTTIYVYNSIIEGGRVPNQTFPNDGTNIKYHINGNDDFTNGNSFDLDPMFTEFITPQTSGSSNTIYNFINGVYTLKSNSPAINKGENNYYSSDFPETDLAGYNRITSSIIDLGAYEYGSILPSTYCIKPGASGASLQTSIGISTFNNITEDWPYNVPNGTIVLESSTKGFVITRVEGVTDLPGQVSSISNPVKGMLVFDKSSNCFRLRNENFWGGCLERTCNE